VLTVESIDLYYGAAQALRHVSVAAEPGNITCVRGRNGACVALAAVFGAEATTSATGIASGRIARNGRRVVRWKKRTHGHRRQIAPHLPPIVKRDTPFLP
jgi:urea transport system ATP-binding protein